MKFLVFRSPKILPNFFPFFSLFWPVSIPSPIFLSHLILSAIFFHWPSQQFGPLAQFSLVIFDLQPRAAAFGLHDRHVALRCVVHLRHCGVASPPPSILL
jgi:hypothetical protein